ncbi:MAG: hypothetical protein RIC03_22375, partial [Cyclobacteriaceae bacterium]
FSPVILIFKVLQREICDYLFNPEPANLLFAISRTTLLTSTTNGTIILALQRLMDTLRKEDLPKFQKRK